MAAVLTATSVVVALLCIKLGYDKTIFRVFLTGFVYTFGYALPGFIATVAIARILDLRACVFFIIVGGMDGVLSLILWEKLQFSGSFSIRFNPISLMVLAGGLAGGLVYWLAAYWRRGTIV